MNTKNLFSNLSKQVHNHNYRNHNDCDDLLSNVLSLKLYKPAHWKWELTTSKSSSSIAPPRILLYDHKDKLLADTKSNAFGEQVYRSDHTADKSLISKRSLDIHLNTEKMRNISERRSRKSIELSSIDLPNKRTEHGKHFNSSIDVPVPNTSLATITSTTGNDNIATSKSSFSGGRGKRNSKRFYSSSYSSSLNSHSIMERCSTQNETFSSGESINDGHVSIIKADAQDMQKQRYFLRTSRVGTLIVQADSFQFHPHRRRRQYHIHSIDTVPDPNASNNAFKSQ